MWNIVLIEQLQKKRDKSKQQAKLREPESPKQQVKNSDPNLNSEKVYLMEIKNGPNRPGTDPLQKVFPNLMLPLLSFSSISKLSVSFLIRTFHIKWATFGFTWISNPSRAGGPQWSWKSWHQHPALSVWKKCLKEKPLWMGSLKAERKKNSHKIQLK